MRADGMIESMNRGPTDTKVRLRLTITDQQDRRLALTHGWMMHNDVEVAFWRVLAQPCRESHQIVQPRSPMRSGRVSSGSTSSGSASWRDGVSRDDHAVAINPTFQRLRVSASIFANSCTFTFFIAFFRSPTVLLAPMSTGKGLPNPLIAQQKSLNSSSEPMINQFVGKIAVDCVPLLNRPDRLESCDQVEVIEANGVVANQKPAECVGEWRENVYN